MIRKWWKDWLRTRSANRAVRRARRDENYKPQLLQLEERAIPSAYVPTAGDHQWMGLQTAYLLGQKTSPIQFTYAHQWVVGLTSSANADALAQQFGVQSDEATTLIDRTHIWDFAANDDYQATAAGLADAKQDGLVAFYYPSLSYAYTPFFKPNDPRYSEQWHLNNTGQNGGIGGEDIKAELGWDVAKGAAQMIVVTDTGTEIDHPDLVGTRWTNPDEVAGNGVDDDGNGFVDDLYGWNFQNDSNDPSSGDHGTSVTGIAAGDGDNSVGMTGVAFDARWSAFKAIGTSGSTDANLAKALSYKKQYAAVYTNSWGINAIDDLASFGPLMKAAIVDSITNGRNGLGSVMVFAAGNSGDVGERTNYHEPENMPFVLNVSALTSSGTLASYSTFGASVFVAAPSASHTTDETGSAGYDSGDYTTSFGGTSAAAPVVAGIAADILSVNPNLLGRDVFHIIAETATKIDPNDPSWQVNGAGFNTSNKYGFGRPDLGAALNLARTWKSVGNTLQSEIGSAAPSLAIPDNDTTGASSTIAVSKNFEAEYVIVRTQITHGSRGQLEIELVSPSGTRSLLAEVHSDTNADFNWQFASTQFWGEKIAGQWTLIVRDKVSGTTGTLDNWELEIIGVPGLPPGFGGGGDFLQIVPSPVNEGSTTVLSGRFSDPDGAGERHFVDVNWGDGTPTERYQLFIGQTSFNIPHRFRDSGTFTVLATVLDERGNPSAPGSGTVVVNNVAPTATIFGAPLTAAEGQTLNLWGAISDPGVLDSHTFVWTVTKNGVFYANGNDQAFSFTPDDQGTYRVDLTAIDDDGGIGHAVQARVAVTNGAPTGTFSNDGPKPNAPQTVTFTFNAIDGGADLASMRYSYDFNNDGDFIDSGDILNSLQPTATFNFAFNGIFTVHGRMTDKEGAFTDLTTTAVVGVPSFYDPTTRYYATGAGFGMLPVVRVFNLNNTPLFDFVAYAPGFQGGVRVATGDVNGDGTEDIITAPGAGGGPHVRVFNGVDGSVVKEFMAPGLPFGYTGGLNVASGDLNSDGRADIILGATTGFVIVVDGASPTNAILGGMNFQPFAGFAGLVNVGSGDQNGDRIMDLVVGAGPGSLPFVRVYGFDFLTGAPLLRNTITAFETTMRGGVSVAIGDVNGDGRGDIIVGSGSQARYLSRVKVFNGANLARTIWNFAPFPGYTGGIQVTAEDLDGDGRSDLLLTPNKGTVGRIVALNGKNLRRLAFFMPYDADFLGGVHVG